MKSELLSQDELNLIRHHLSLKTFGCEIHGNWGSLSNKNHKIEIAKSLQNRQFTSSSVSHSQDWGGFIWTKDANVQLGFDIEKTARVSSELVGRVASSEKELSEAPHPAALWTAKEAVFKALRGPFQPKVLSQVTVGNWENQASQIETFQFVRQIKVGNSVNSGVVIAKELYTLAFFSFRP